MSKKKLEIHVEPSSFYSISVGAAIGSVSYIGHVRVFQRLLKTVGIHSGLPVISSLMGGSMLSGAFIQSNVTMVYTSTYIKRFLEDNKSTEPILGKSTETLVSSTVLNVIFYKYGFKQKFRNALPSHIILPGSFAREYIQLRSVKVTRLHKQFIQEIGKHHGCHHCGAKTTKYISDHIPCTKFISQLGTIYKRNPSWFRYYLLALYQRDLLSKSSYPQALYPQCRTCSNSQGSFVGRKSFFASLYSTRGIVMHRLRYQPYLVFVFPIYIILDRIDIKFG